MTNSMTNLANEASKLIENLKGNKIIMDFVTNEALEKCAADIREKTGSGTTAKAVELLRITNKQINDRVEEYITVGMMSVIAVRREMI